MQGVEERGLRVYFWILLFLHGQITTFVFCIVNLLLLETIFICMNKIELIMWATMLLLIDIVNFFSDACLWGKF